MPCRSSKSGQEVIQGYTPANYISYSDRTDHACRHLVGVSVQAPVAVCFDLWNDWARLVDFLDLISQVWAAVGGRGRGERLEESNGNWSAIDMPITLLPVFPLSHTQIGLDPDEPDMGLFQCFYRWGEAQSSSFEATCSCLLHWRYTRSL